MYIIKYILTPIFLVYETYLCQKVRKNEYGVAYKYHNNIMLFLKRPCLCPFQLDDPDRRS